MKVERATAQSRCLANQAIPQLPPACLGASQVIELLQWSLCVRALCHLVLKQYKEAVKDCTEALKLDGKNVKAFYRRAQAYKALKVKMPTQAQLEVYVGASSSVFLLLRPGKASFFCVSSCPLPNSSLL